MPTKSIDTPLGRVRLVEEEGAITALRWGDGESDGDRYDEREGEGAAEREEDEDTPLLVEAGRQLGAYFARELETFDLPLRPAGGEFQRAVAAALSAIPYGETREYGELARELGSLPQPVGNACGRNTVPIVVPCHRVVGASGPGGFSAAGGVETKLALLRHEGAYSLLF